MRPRICHLACSTSEAFVSPPSRLSHGSSHHADHPSERLHQRRPHVRPRRLLFRIFHLRVSQQHASQPTLCSRPTAGNHPAGERQLRITLAPQPIRTRWRVSTAPPANAQCWRVCVTAYGRCTPCMHALHARPACTPCMHALHARPACTPCRCEGGILIAFCGTQRYSRSWSSSNPALCEESPTLWTLIRVDVARMGMALPLPIAPRFNLSRNPALPPRD